MLIEKSGSDDFEAAWAELLDALQQQRVDLLGSTIDIHVGIGLLAGAEADRLAGKFGADDARVQVLRDRGDAGPARVAALAPIAVTPGATQVIDMSLSAAELERLRLRMPVTPDNRSVKAPSVEAAPVPDKAAGDKTTTDKATADKGATSTAPAETREQV